MFRGIVTGVLVSAVLIAVAAAPGAPRDEYAKRAAKLDAKDVVRHYELALWCKDNGLWDLVLRECDTVLEAKPTHSQAKRLMRMAKRRLAKSKKDSKPKETVGGKAPAGDKPDKKASETGLLSAEDVQRLRFGEIVLPNPDRKDVQPDKVPIQFARNVLKDFWKEMEGEEGYKDRASFFKKRPIEKLAAIVRETGWKYQPDIEIMKDPKVFAEFKTGVWPILLKGCATSNCHSGPNAAKFRLYTSAAQTPEQLYTNFVILDSIKVEDEFLIDRDRVKESLLLHYGLPAKETKRPHPGDVKPIFRDSKDRNYRLIEDWIYLLVQNPEYEWDPAEGVKVAGEKEEEEEPADPEAGEKKG